MELDWAEDFYAEGLLTEILMRLKSGKEATVYLCRGSASAPAQLVAAKVYRDRAGRGFQNRAAYQTGRLFGGTRANRAVCNKSRVGRRIEEACWIGRKFDVLCNLHAAGADVPRPLAAHGSTILMEYVGTEATAAPRLRDVVPPLDHAQRLFDRLMWNVECFLDNHIVHADLSPFNILVRGDDATIIDFPQAIDSRYNGDAEQLLTRDVACLCRYFGKLGLHVDAGQISSHLWCKYAMAHL